MTDGNIAGNPERRLTERQHEGQVDMQLERAQLVERAQPRWLSTRARFLVIAVIVLAVAGVTIPLLAHSPTTARPSGSTKASPPALAMRSFAGYAGRPALPGASRLAVKAIASAGGVRLAVGSADGYPAIWKQASGGS